VPHRTRGRSREAVRERTVVPYRVCTVAVLDGAEAVPAGAAVFVEVDAGDVASPSACSS
jgi:hypothetical protein